MSLFPLYVSRSSAADETKTVVVEKSHRTTVGINSRRTAGKIEVEKVSWSPRCHFASLLTGQITMTDFHHLWPCVTPRFLFFYSYFRIRLWTLIETNRAKFRTYNRSARCLALNWSPLVGADFSPANRRRDCAARRTTLLLRLCTPCLRFNPPSKRGTRRSLPLTHNIERIHSLSLLHSCVLQWGKRNEWSRGSLAHTALRCVCVAVRRRASRYLRCEFLDGFEWSHTARFMY